MTTPDLCPRCSEPTRDDAEHDRWWCMNPRCDLFNEPQQFAEPSLYARVLWLEEQVEMLRARLDERGRR